jgi:putative glutamine amidotransferase
MKRIVLLATLLLANSAFANDAIRLISVRLHGSAHPELVLPARSDESPRAAAAKYFKLLARDAELSSLFQGQSRFSTPRFSASEWTDHNVQTLIVANRPTDLIAGDLRVASFTDRFAENGVATRLLPFAADLGLTENQEFPSLVLMGGDDVDQRLFGRDNYALSQVNSRRDRFEKSVIEAKLSSIREQRNQIRRPHRILGVCRGAQFVAAVMGYSIGYHIPDDFNGSDVLHGPGNDFHFLESEPMHSVRMLPTANSVLRRSTGDTEEIEVNSYHHQYVQFQPGGELELAALSPDGVPEAFESLDGSIVLKQFHAELMVTRGKAPAKGLGERIMNGLVQFLTGTDVGPQCEGALSGS